MLEHYKGIGFKRRYDVGRLVRYKIEEIEQEYTGTPLQEVFQEIRRKICVREVIQHSPAYHVFTKYYDQNINHMYYREVAANPYAINEIEDRYPRREYDYLFDNPSGSHLMERNIKAFGKYNLTNDWVTWLQIARNPGMIDLIRKYKTNVQVCSLAANPALDLIPPVELFSILIYDARETYRFGPLPELCWNPSAIDFIRTYPKVIDWSTFSENINGVDIFEENLDKVDKHKLTLNPAAIDLLRNHPELIVWEELPNNPNARELIEENENNESLWVKTDKERYLRRIRNGPESIEDYIKDCLFGFAEIDDRILELF